MNKKKIKEEYPDMIIFKKDGYLMGYTETRWWYFGKTGAKKENDRIDSKYMAYLVGKHQGKPCVLDNPVDINCANLLSIQE